MIYGFGSAPPARALLGDRWHASIPARIPLWSVLPMEIDIHTQSLSAPDRLMVASSPPLSVLEPRRRSPRYTIHRAVSIVYAFDAAALVPS